MMYKESAFVTPSLLVILVYLVIFTVVVAFLAPMFTVRKEMIVRVDNETIKVTKTLTGYLTILEEFKCQAPIYKDCTDGQKNLTFLKYSSTSRIIFVQLSFCCPFILVGVICVYWEVGRCRHVPTNTIAIIVIFVLFEILHSLAYIFYPVYLGSEIGFTWKDLDMGFYLELVNIVFVWLCLSLKIYSDKRKQFKRKYKARRGKFDHVYEARKFIFVEYNQAKRNTVLYMSSVRESDGSNGENSSIQKFEHDNNCFDIEQEHGQIAQQPVTDEHGQNTQQPVIDEHGQNMQQPVIYEHGRNTRQPVIDEHGRNRNTRQPVIDEHGQNTQQPVTDEHGQNTRQPVRDEHGQNTQQPVIDEHGQNTQQPVIDEHGQNTQQPVIDEHGQNTQQPVIDEHGQNTQQPVTDEHGQNTQQPVIDENTQQPVIDEHGQNMQQPVIDEHGQNMQQPVIDEHGQNTQQPVTGGHVPNMQQLVTGGHVPNMQQLVTGGHVPNMQQLVTGEHVPNMQQSVIGKHGQNTKQTVLRELSQNQTTVGNSSANALGFSETLLCKAANEQESNCIKSLIYKLWCPKLVGLGKDAHSLRYSRINIKTVDRVHSQAVWQRYMKKKEDILNSVQDNHIDRLFCPEDFGADIKPVQTDDALKLIPENNLQTNLDRKINEHYLFHGTDFSNIYSIIQRGFDKSTCHRKMLGKGIYFTDHPVKADQYTDVRDVYGEQASCCMILARVLLGNSVITKIRNADLRSASFAPCKTCLSTECVHDRSNKFDSLIFDGGLFREYVIYENQLAYPEYIIYYDRIESEH